MHVLSKPAKSKFASFFHVREQFITEKVTLFKVLLYLKVGNKKQLSNQVDNLMNIPLGIILHKEITYSLIDGKIFSCILTSSIFMQVPKSASFRCPYLSKSILSGFTSLCIKPME